VARVIFERKTVGVALGELVPPRAYVAAAPVVPGAQHGNAPLGAKSPVPATRHGTGTAKDYRAMIVAHQKRSAASKPFSTH
jgi:hypothetical protein